MVHIDNNFDDAKLSYFVNYVRISLGMPITPAPTALCRQGKQGMVCISISILNVFWCKIQQFMFNINNYVSFRRR